MSYINVLFNGRLNRQTFFFGEILFILLILLLNIFSKHFNDALNKFPEFISILLGLVTLALLIMFQLSLLGRRLHDLGSTDLERNISINVFEPPYYKRMNPLRYFKKGNPKENQFGKPPKPKIDLIALFNSA